MKTEKKHELPGWASYFKDQRDRAVAEYCEELIQEHKEGTYADALNDVEGQRKQRRYLNGNSEDAIFQLAIDWIVKAALNQRIASQK